METIKCVVKTRDIPWKQYKIEGQILYYLKPGRIQYETINLGTSYSVGSKLHNKEYIQECIIREENRKTLLRILETSCLEHCIETNDEFINWSKINYKPFIYAKSKKKCGQ